MLDLHLDDKKVSNRTNMIGEDVSKARLLTEPKRIQALFEKKAERAEKVGRNSKNEVAKRTKLIFSSQTLITKTRNTQSPEIFEIQSNKDDELIKIVLSPFTKQTAEIVEILSKKQDSEDEDLIVPKKENDPPHPKKRKTISSSQATLVSDQESQQLKFIHPNPKIVKRSLD